ncbi:hypothetical protein [Methylobacterium fujisawaense]
MEPRRPIVPGTFTLPFERRNRPGSPEAQRGSERAALTRRARTRPVTLARRAEPFPADPSPQPATGRAPVSVP